MCERIDLGLDLAVAFAHVISNTLDSTVTNSSTKRADTWIVASKYIFDILNSRRVIVGPKDVR